jgi:hypothetical protein
VFKKDVSSGNKENELEVLFDSGEMKKIFFKTRMVTGEKQTWTEPRCIQEFNMISYI